MKSRVRSSALGSPSSSSVAPAYYKYLKPGELAQLRYSKINARSKQISAQTLLALYQLGSDSDSSLPHPISTGLAMEAVPCFNLRAKGFPRCLMRKKLLAVAPVFTET
ncbi:hypothetical protein AAHA92_29855 [Salvia divinorum]|uniref:Uncharacterized protein n=1 Tax=Salvia divinorum TaxID=28513 RepID=A0ABD1G2N4_SALDI